MSDDDVLRRIRKARFGETIEEKCQRLESERDAMINFLKKEIESAPKELLPPLSDSENYDDVSQRECDRESFWFAERVRKLLREIEKRG